VNEVALFAPGAFQKERERERKKREKQRETERERERSQYWARVKGGDDRPIGVKHASDKKSESERQREREREREREGEDGALREATSNDVSLR